MSIYKEKYLKYKKKYIKLKGGAINFLDFPCSIYHAFDMKFNEVKTKLRELKDNGVTHIQLSPIQECRTEIGQVLLKKKNKTEDKQVWWLAYQPYSYKIGNVYGTEEEFKELIKECKENNLELIIDIVINHISAPLKYEYAVWDLLLVINDFDKIKDNPEYTLWDLYYNYNEKKIDIFKYLEEYKLDIDRTYNIKRLIYDLLYDTGDVTTEEYKKYQKSRIFENGKFVNKIDIINTILEPKIKDNKDKIKNYINDAFSEIKKLICKYLDITEDKFKPEYYDIITVPYWCSDTVSYGYNCWLAQALPQLNQQNKIVREKILRFLDKLHEYGILNLRIDAASHIHPKILKFYKDYFMRLTENRAYIYSEVINPQGTQISFNLHDYVKLTHITEYNLLLKLLDIFCYDCDLSRLNVLDLPSGDIGSVVFSTTHDLEKIDGERALSRFGNFTNVSDNENYKINLMLCYLLQRTYNVPLIFKTQFEDIKIKETIKFRKYLFDNECSREESKVIDNIVFKSIKYNKVDKILGIYYINISDIDKQIDNITVSAKNIYI